MLAENGILLVTQVGIFLWSLVPSPAREGGAHHEALRAANNTPAKLRMGPRTCSALFARVHHALAAAF